MKFYQCSRFRLSIFFVLNILLVFNSSCQQIKTKENKIGINHIKKDIPEYRQTPKFHLIKEKIEKEIGISSLENGFDGMEIRIWFAYSTLMEHLIILQKTNNIWHGRIYVLTYNYDSTNSLISISKSIREVQPKSGWNFFIDSLFKLKLLTLPDMSSIEGYELGRDGTSIGVEIATKDSYRIYSYWSPTEKSKFWQARNIEFIARLMEEELRFKRF